MLAQVNGAQIYFDVEGMGLAPVGVDMVEKPVAFVLHGGPGMDHSYFKPWLSPLAEDFQLVYIDHRGTGRSERVALETCTIEQMADDIEELRKLLGLGKITVIGNSFGGMWAQVHALRYPDSVDRLVLVTTSPSHAFWEAASAQLETRATPEQKRVGPTLFEGKVTDEDEFIAWWEVMIPLYFHRWNKEREDALVKRGKDNPLVAAYMFEKIIPHYDVRAGLPSLSVPTLVCSGRHDWVTPVSECEAIVELIPGSELVMFEESGHMPFIEEQDKFVDVVRDFLKRTS
ncbi:MAG: alpha/beta hydrolase [Thermomicrobiales bacterium]|nr:alpha/beta hydrolase [Thermomicrobiales bacterium]